MEQAVTTLWNKNFNMLVIGQIVSLFGNGILRFALPLYIYLESGSPELFGTVMALSVIPMILVSPFGGVLADRVNKKRLIVFLDFFVAILVFAYLWVIGSLSIVPITIIMLMLLISTNSMMASATDSSYPLIVPANQLVRANSLTMAINTLSMMLGPMLGGFLIIQFGLTSLLIVGGICFSLAAFMETFIKIPTVKQEFEGNAIRLILSDLRKGIFYVSKTQSTIGKMLIMIAMLNFLAAGFAFIGIPVLTIHNLGMDDRLVGVAVGVMGAGGIVAGIISGILGQKVRIQKSHRALFFNGVVFIPLALVFLLPFNHTLAFVVMTIIMFCIMCATTIVTIQCMAFIQKVTPPDVLGKVIALIMTSTVLAQPLGNWIYGILLGRFGDSPWVFLFPVSVLIMILALWTRTFFTKIPVETSIEKTN